jgi:hypothetical protein
VGGGNSGNAFISDKVGSTSERGAAFLFLYAKSGVLSKLAYWGARPIPGDLDTLSRVWTLLAVRLDENTEIGLASITSNSTEKYFMPWRELHAI